MAKNLPKNLWTLGLSLSLSLFVPPVPAARTDPPAAPASSATHESKQADTRVAAQSDGAMAPSAVFPTTPVKRPDGNRWRLGYFESGDYSEYPRTLKQIVNGLERLDWLTLDQDMPPGMDGKHMWNWLSGHVHSDYLEFVADAWWQPGNFDSAQRAPVREAIRKRIQTRHDLDLILAMGTWAGQDMRAIGPPIPTEVASASDPIAAGIADSAEDSGRRNLHMRIEPERYQRQLRLFHSIVPFRKLGMVFEDSTAGRSYAAYGAVKQVSRELGFSIKACHASFSDISAQDAADNAIRCYRELAEQDVDAAYITSNQGITPESIKTVADILAAAKIPSFSMAGSDEVKHGVLLSLAQADLSYVGLFHAESIARVFHGATPRELSQIWVDPPKIALNLLTAREIGFDPPVDILLAADEVYQKTE